ncbi:exodeoxyribonuclease VII large subunit [Candidatus Hydrogenosomobacter endosymbioticus]|uniref:Exodeoxyribonuclease 7 large subunit n=1 Tax=Candidatus Hydrogenosomobacter endosymbioticus TaxID=2558174 RepID=A0ABM7V975_9PROT|nr:exodeoxyribonuclease VII large subunit [Candidatus Hydrogenosomobacter endosymbioticus]BDB96340.1 exodeoxyribonuclease 7 large subunit [Candidatus Hydrogenosomobacter endosymbioticus]
MTNDRTNGKNFGPSDKDSATSCEKKKIIARKKSKNMTKTSEQQELSFSGILPMMAFTVSQLSGLIRQNIESNFSHIEVQGEISGLKVHSSGHAYFVLKDKSSAIDCVCWKGAFAKLAIAIEDGMEVVCRGSVTVYSARSKYQVIAQHISHSGQGALLKLIEERKKKLASEGLFSRERKKELPFLPNIIGIITSPTGAVIQDILHRLNDRMPTHVILFPVNVQGSTAAEEVIAAIRHFNSATIKSDKKPDVIIIARGGGSIEDLWPFNDEELVREVAASVIPIISAIGHETDTTLIDYASDIRAPTPTAAAELAVPVRKELLSSLNTQKTRIRSSCISIMSSSSMKASTAFQKLSTLKNFCNNKRSSLSIRIEKTSRSFLAFFHKKHNRHEIASSRIKKAPIKEVALLSQKSNLTKEKVIKAIYRLMQANTEKTESCARLLHALSHKNTLNRGFSLIYDSSGNLLKSITQVDISFEPKPINIKFFDGSANGVINYIARDEQEII